MPSLQVTCIQQKLQFESTLCQYTLTLIVFKIAMQILSQYIYGPC
uniref:Uncharacterized protein n=1 Tax=Arundo donax TaxID=35708 RepID=A0A0A8ZWD7_ARUDO